jgi:hypothetical protein
MAMRTAVFALLIASTTLVACKDPGSRDSLGGQAGAIGSDTKTLEAANAAASEVVRSAGDCDAVKRALPGAESALSDASARVETATGRQVIETLKKQVRTVADACP